MTALTGVSDTSLALGLMGQRVTAPIFAAREVNMNVDQNQEGDCPWSADGEHHYVNGKCRFCGAKQ